MIFSFVFEILSKIAPITRAIMLVVFGLGLLVNLEICSETSFYYDYDLIFNKEEYWRLITSLFFVGKFDTGPLVHLYFLYIYSAGLEDHSYRSKSEDFFLLVVLIILSLIGLCYLTDEPFVSP